MLFGSVCADQTRCDAAHPIALALVTISRLSLTPGSGSHALRCNRHALIMQMSLGRVGPLLMSDWHVHSGYIERRNASRLTVHLIHDRAFCIDDRASFSSPHPLSFLLPLPCRPHRVSCLVATARLPRIFPADCILRRERNIGILILTRGASPFRSPRMGET